MLLSCRVDGVSFWRASSGIGRGVVSGCSTTVAIVPPTAIEERPKGRESMGYGGSRTPSSSKLTLEEFVWGLNLCRRKKRTITATRIATVRAAPLEITTIIVVWLLEGEEEAASLLLEGTATEVADLLAFKVKEGCGSATVGSRLAEGVGRDVAKIIVGVEVEGEMNVDIVKMADDGLGLEAVFICVEGPNIACVSLKYPSAVKSEPSN